MMQQGKPAFVRGEGNPKNVRFAFGAQFGKCACIT